MTNVATRSGNLRLLFRDFYDRVRPALKVCLNLQTQITDRPLSVAWTRADWSNIENDKKFDQSARVDATDNRRSVICVCKCKHTFTVTNYKIFLKSLGLDKIPSKIWCSFVCGI